MKQISDTDYKLTIYLLGVLSGKVVASELRKQNARQRARMLIYKLQNRKKCKKK